MVYGFFLIGTFMIGAIYWAASMIEPAQEVMWSPGSGLIEPEPWLKTKYGGYFGWAPTDTRFSGWSPGAYFYRLKPKTSTTTITTTTTETTTTTTTTKIPTRLPTLLPTIPSSPEDKPSDASSSSRESQRIPPSDTEPSFDEDKKPSGLRSQEPPRQTESGPPPLKPINAYYEYGFRRFWKSKDQNEEAYEEIPHDFTNTRPPDKLPVEGWGYDYDNTG